MKYRIITEYGDSPDGPWHMWIEHEQVVEFSRPVTEKERTAPLMEIEGIPIRMRYEPVETTESVKTRQ